tara:strand:- start:1141 stop:1509 length:369 start_codon:yes stop_codon:yes gene_type:complete
MNLKELRSWATEHNIKGRSSMNKADLQAEHENWFAKARDAWSEKPQRKPEDYENALRAVVGITMDTLRGDSPFDPPADEDYSNAEIAEFAALMQGIVDKGIQQKRSKATQRRRRARLNKRGY